MATQTIPTTTDRCRRCGAHQSLDVVLWASVDLNATICGPCHYEFDAWADKNPDRPYREFLPARHRARRAFRTRRLERAAEREHHEWAARGLERPTYQGRHAADVEVVA